MTIIPLLTTTTALARADMVPIHSIAAQDTKRTTIGAIADFAAASALASGQPYVDLAKAWAQSPTPPDPLDITSKSAKTWATAAAASAVTAALYGGVQVDTLPDLYALTSGQVAVGQWVLVRSTGWAYQRTADAAVDADVVPPDSVLKFYGRGATDVRKNANLGTAINFFDFLMDGYTDGDRASIALGTYMGDLAVPWVAFRNALAVEAAAGRRPHGVIPQCTIRTSVSPNFAMNFLTLETHGIPHIIATGTNNGFNIDGRDLGVGGFGVRSLDIGAICASSVGGTYGWFVTWCHMSEFRLMESQGAVFAGIGILSCVTSKFNRPMGSAQIVPWITQPAHVLYLSRIASGVGNSQTSWCTFTNPVLEYSVDTGVYLDHTFGNNFYGGTAEGIGFGGGLGRGIVLTANAKYNKFFGMDMEANTGYNVHCLGSNNEFHAVDSGGGGGATTAMRFEGTGALGNKVFGGHYSYIELTADTLGNLICGAMVGTLADASVGPDYNRSVHVTNTLGVWRDTWQTYTPTLSASSGTFTSAAANGHYRIIDGDTVHFRAEVVITTNGTAAGGIVLGLPLTSKNNTTSTGVEIAATGKQVGGRALAAGNTMLVRFSDGTYPGANGYTISISGTYQRQ